MYYPDDDSEILETFPDGRSLDAKAATDVLRPYPELLRQWQIEVCGPWKEGYGPGPGGLRRLHSPTYLRAVVREYLHLRNGGDQIDPGLAARCDQIAAARREVTEQRRSYLSDPWARAQSADMLGYEPLTVALCYNPEYLQSRVEYFTRREDPFDEVSIWERDTDARWNARSLKEAEAPWN